MRLRRLANNPMLPPHKILQNKAEKRCRLHGRFPPTASRFSCWNRGRVRWCCCATAGPNCPIPGGTKSRRSRRPVSVSRHPICAVSAEPARPPTSTPTVFSTPSATWSLLLPRSAKSRPSSSAMTGARRSPGTPRCFAPMFSPPLRGRGRPLDTLRQSGITNFYWQYFQSPGVAEAEFERDVGLSMRTLLGRGFSDPSASLFVADGKGFLGEARADRPLPDWLGQADLAHFTEPYRKSGFRGGLNWYRNIDRNWELTAPWQDAQIHQPSLFIAGSRDSVITGLIGAKRVTELERVLSNLKQKLIIEGAGHWGQQERAAEVNAALIGFLREAQ